MDARRNGGEPGAEPLDPERPDEIDRHEESKDPERAAAVRRGLASGLVEVADHFIAVLAPETGRAERQRRAIQPAVE